jgi:plastocyanin
MRWITTVIVAATCVVATAPGCSRESATKGGEAGRSKTVQAPLHPDPTKTGAVIGRVKFEGTPPPPTVIQMSADPYCAQVNGGGVKRESVEVGKDGGLRDVFVYVKSGLGNVRYEPPTEPAVLDQVRCMYRPTVLGVQVGQPLTIRNSDKTLHNVHALPDKSSGFNIGMPSKGMTATRKFSEPEVLVRIKCDVHPWMEAYVGVVDNPFFAVTHVSGQYRIGGLPPGTYTIEAVHPKLGRRSREVTVAAGEEVGANFSFSAK